MNVLDTFLDTASQSTFDISSFLADHLGKELLWIDTLHPNNTDIKEANIYVVAVEDCINACFLLRSFGFSMISVPNYSTEGLCATMRDQEDNTYLLKEERFYEFDLPL
ncbi:hypothetical protein D3C73_1318990 [compost metagenome]